MTPPAQALLHNYLDEETTAPELFGQWSLPEVSNSMYAYERLRKAAKALLNDHSNEIARQRLTDGQRFGVLALLDEAASVPKDEALHAAAEELARIGASYVGSEWLGEQLANRPNPVIRALSARALGYAAPNLASVSALESALSDSDPDVRDTVVAALAELADPSALPALRAALQDESKAYIREAIEETIEELEG